MARLRDIVLISLVCFTLLALCGLVVVSTAAGAFGTNATGEEAVTAFADDLAEAGFVLFVYSVLVGASFWLFDIKGMSQLIKRALHLFLTYACTIGAFSLLAYGRSGFGIMLFVITFAFIAVYYLGMLVCKGLKKLDAYLGEIKNSKKI